MLKNDVTKRLDELQGCEKLEFVMIDGIRRTVHMQSLHNYEDAEILESPTYNFKTFYCSIAEIHPCS